MKLSKFVLCLVFLGSTVIGKADDARFDLDGPRIDVFITRGPTTLPIARVPNLLPNDVLQIKADLPGTQSNHLLLIVAFLRSTTNEPPDNWFTKIETWKPQPADGTAITVPEGAQRAIMFVAPETGGDFNTLRNAVKLNPGVFLRAAAALDKASLEQQRIQRYLAGMQAVALQDEKMIKLRSQRLATALALTPNASCFAQPVANQVDCLTQTSTPVLLDDGHGQTVADAISTGPSSDFINEASQTDGAAYSAYVGTLIDLVHLAVSLRTAKYHYIPAISFPQGPTLNLRLNAPPSFANPMSVIVIGLPPIEPSVAPQVRLPDEAPALCLLEPSMLVTLRAAPLIFSTDFGHELTLDVEGRRHVLTPDPLTGSLFASGDDPHQNAMKTSVDINVSGTISGYWGFEPFNGPTLLLQQLPGKRWILSGAGNLLAGQDAHITLQGDGTACVRQVTLGDGKGKATVLVSQPITGGGIDLKLPLTSYLAGTYSLVIQQYGTVVDYKIPVPVYVAGIRLDHVVRHPQENTVALFGRGVEAVSSVSMGGWNYKPTAMQAEDNGRLELRASSASNQVSTSDATVTLNDGRQMSVPVVLAGSGSDLQLVSFETVPDRSKDELEIELHSKMDIPLEGKLKFVVHSSGVFPRSQKIEVAAGEGSVSTILTLNSDSLILQDAHTAVASVELAKVFGGSTFGPLRIRAVPGDGTFGAWTTLGTLVRQPHITAVHCSDGPSPVCMIEGSELFLAIAFSSGKVFGKATIVPTGFDQSTFSVPAKARVDTLYVWLRDDPQSVAIIRLP
jgi:hypothetical protein